MPSLWDLLCVSRQQKYTTHDKSRRRPHDAWEDPPYYDPSNVEYYIRPDIHSSRRTDSHSSLSSFQYGNVQSPRSPSSRRDLRVHESCPADPQHSPPWYVEVRSPRSPSSTEDFMLQDRDAFLLLKNSQGSRVEPAQPETHAHLQSGEPNFVGNEAGSSGKRRHVKDIFADVTPQSDDSKYRLLNTSTTSVASSYSHRSDQLGRTDHETSGLRQSSGYGQSSRSRQISISRQTSGTRQELKQHSRSKHSSRLVQPKDSRDSSGHTQNTGLKPSSKAKQTESMHQYSPRTVSDNAISAALFGNRIDDFVHDPSWNRSIDKFAASPTSTSAFSFGDKSFSSSTNKSLASSTGRSMSSSKTLSPKDSDGNVTFVVAAQPNLLQSKHDCKQAFQSNTRHQSDSRTSPTVYEHTLDKLSAHEAGFRRSDNERNMFNSGISKSKMQVPDLLGELQTGPESEENMEKLFNANGEVLY